MHVKARKEDLVHNRSSVTDNTGAVGGRHQSQNLSKIFGGTLHSKYTKPKSLGVQAWRSGKGGSSDDYNVEMILGN